MGATKAYNICILDQVFHSVNLFSASQQTESIFYYLRKGHVIYDSGCDDHLDSDVFHAADPREEEEDK